MKIRAVRETRGSTTIERHLDEAGAVVQELFKAPKGKVMLSRGRSEAGGVEETYFVRGKLVSAEKYEKARAEFPDLPAADAALDRWGGLLQELRTDLRRERRASKSAAVAVVADPAAAAEKDRACRKVLAETACLPLAQFLDTPGAVLGTLSPRSSRAAVSRFEKLGAAEITVWGVSRLPGEPTFCEGLVVGLPGDADARSALFRQAGRIAAADGYSAEADVGQSLLFVRFG